MKKFIYLVSIACTQLLSNTSFAQESLPVGSHPPALEFNHFPSKYYAVVWRNWNLVAPERIALTVGASAAQITATAASMGLPPARVVSADFKKRIYITVIRRNWHLLPYEQLLLLLDMTEKELAFALKEDDFLYIKLGSLKPDCKRVVYEPPTRKTEQQLAHIKQTAAACFSNPALAVAEQPFQFVQQLQQVPAHFQPAAASPDQLRYIYSYFGIFGDPLIDTLHDPYPDGLLAQLAQKGVTGVWMHVVLNQLAPGGASFPEFGQGHETRITNLKRITERAKQYGIAVYLYMNEPRAMPVDFFTTRPGMMGANQGDFKAMCTAHPAVALWMEDALSFIFKAVPQLGGVFTITASENHTHCASHGNQASCPRCSKRDYADIIADVNAIIARGVHKGNPQAKVIVWDWGWHGHGLAPDIIAKLPKDVWLMSVSEWAKAIERGGVASRVGEYSISAVGPGNRSQQHWAWAKQAGLKTVAKVQFNNTWELSAVPWLPVSYLVAQHAANLANAGTNGLMLSWSLGGYPSPNLEIAQAFANKPGANIETVLTELANRRYGQVAAPLALKAWRAFSTAFSEFPYNISTVYTAPLQYGPSNLLYGRPTGYTATMVGFPYDDLNSWRSIYPADIFIAQMKKVSTGWQEGLQYYRQMLSLSSRGQADNVREEQQVATAAWLHFASVANQSQFVACRDSLLLPGIGTEIKRKLRMQIQLLLDSEIKIAAQLFEISQKDSRIGYEASNQYYYTSQDLVEKILNCRHLKDIFTKTSAIK